MTSLTTSDWTLYHDFGSTAATTGQTLSSFTGSTNYIGWDSIDNKWQGAIGCVRMWKRVLSRGEINTILGDPLAGLARPDRQFMFAATVGGGATRRDRMFIAL
jgi:hypothetical protein